LIALRPHIFVSYHHGNDQGYYDAFTNAFHNSYEVVRDRSLDREVDSDDPDYVIRRIRERYITGTSCTVLLCGADTPGRKYVDWEIKATLDKQHGLIGVYLPTARRDHNGIYVPGRYYDNWATGYAPWYSWEAFTASTSSVASAVALANARSRTLINNSRDRRLRNS
jgi:hypothetical protein